MHSCRQILRLVMLASSVVLIVAVYPATTTVMDMRIVMMVVTKPTVPRSLVRGSSCARKVDLMASLSAFLSRSYVIRKRTVRITPMKKQRAVSTLEIT